MPLDSASGRKQRRMVFSNTQDLVGCLGLPVPDNGLELLCLAKNGLRYRPTLIELHRVLTNKQAAMKSRMTENCLLEERLHVTEDDLEAAGMA